MTETEKVQSAIDRKFSEKLEHDVFIDSSIWVDGKKHAHDPLVALANEDDSYYVTYFKNRDQVLAFIEKLKSAADEVWTGTKG